MLLNDYMRQELGIMRFGGSRGRSGPSHSMHLIDSFEFGEVYMIVMFSGGNIEFKTLDFMLDILRDELRAAGTYDVSIYVGGPHKLVVRPMNTMGRPWGRNVPAMIEHVRNAATVYNLSDQWPPDIKRKGSIHFRSMMERP
jgi:hypothetical protein